MKKRGITLGVIFYALIGLIVALVHWKLGWQDPQYPPTSFFVFTLLMFVAICFALYNWISTLSPKKGDFHKGVFRVHKIMMGSLLIFIFSLVIITKFMY